MAVPAFQRRPKWSWWGGLYYRLLARGVDAGTAKLISRHVRADWKWFAEVFLEAPDEEHFRQVFLGESPKQEES